MLVPSSITCAFMGIVVTLCTTCKGRGQTKHNTHDAISEAQHDPEARSQSHCNIAINQPPRRCVVCCLVHLNEPVTQQFNMDFMQ